MEITQNQIFFSYYLQTITYIHEHKIFSPLHKEDMHIKSQILLPLFVNHQQRGQSEFKSNKFFSPFLSRTKRSRRGNLNQSRRSICKRDVKLSLHIVNTNLKILNFQKKSHFSQYNKFWDNNKNTQFSFKVPNVEQPNFEFWYQLWNTMHKLEDK